MNTNSKILLLTGLFIFLCSFAKAQDKKMQVSTTVGYSLNYDAFDGPSLRSSPGFHLGFNLYKRVPKRFKTDLQLSINLSGRGSSKGNVLSVNPLFGGRYYITNPESSNNVFVNTLIGGSLVRETGDDFYENFLSVGYSVGCYANLNRLVLGLSIESYNNLIIKVGYKF